MPNIAWPWSSRAGSVIEWSSWKRASARSHSSSWNCVTGHDIAKLQMSSTVLSLCFELTVRWLQRIFRQWSSLVCDFT